MASASTSVITTVIPVYNGERYLPATLESVSRQTRKPDRVVILDNASTDRTQEVVGAFQGLPLEWYSHPSNIGANANFSRALDWAERTEFLHLLSSDDLIEPRFFERLIPQLEDAPGRALAYSFFGRIDETGEPIPPFPRRRGARPRMITRRVFLARQAELNTVMLPAVLLKTARQPAPVRFPPDMRQVADVVFLAEWAIRSARIVEVPEVLCHWRRHASNTTNRNLLDLQACLLDEWKAIQTVTHLAGGAGWSRWQKLKCLFASRAQVRIQMLHSIHPQQAEAIRLTARRMVSPAHWQLARIAVGGWNSVRRLRGIPPPQFQED